MERYKNERGEEMVKITPARLSDDLLIDMYIKFKNPIKSYSQEHKKRIKALWIDVRKEAKKRNLLTTSGTIKKIPSSRNTLYKKYKNKRSRSSSRKK